MYAFFKNFLKFRYFIRRLTSAYAAEQGIDVLVFIGSLAEEMYRGAVRAAENLDTPPEGIYYFKEKQEFLARRREILRPKDTVLVKASHGMAFQEIAETLASQE